MRHKPPVDVTKAVSSLRHGLCALATAALVLALAACNGSPASTPHRAAPIAAPIAARTAQALASTDLVITEVMADPSKVADTAGEWFEVYNPGPDPVDLQDWVIQSTNDQPHTIASSVVVPPQGYVVLGRNGDTATNGGVTVAYVYAVPAPGTTLNLNNSSDTVSLTDPDGRLVDTVKWVNKPPSGASLGLLDPKCDNDNASDNRWTTSTAVYGAGDKGTPGAANGPGVDTCPVPPPPPTLEVRINEVMADPAKVFDSAGEWFEVYNPGTTDVDLKGWTITASVPSGGSGYVIPDSVVIPAGGYQVFGINADPATNGGVPGVYAYPGANIGLANGSGYLQLVRADGALVDRVSWNSSATAGASRAMVNPSAANAADVGGSAWTTSAAAWTGSAGDFGSPGAVNPPPVTPPPPTGPTVSVNINAPAHMPVGYMKPSFVTVYDVNGVVVTPTPDVTWSSSDVTVATVDQRGYATAVGEGTANIIATLSDGTSGSAALNVTAAASDTTAVYRDHLAFGTPHDATPDDEILVTHAQYVLSYNAQRGGPNWVSWDINASQFGSADRCNCFTPDPLLPPGVPLVDDFDYRNGGYDRGHMAQSESRTTTDPENAATFLLSNILPQAAANNQGPWSKLENDLNDMARSQNKEVYVIAGGWYPAAPDTLKNEGKVAIPDFTWKVAVVLDAGKGLADVQSTSDLQVIAVWMPNRVNYTGPASADAIRNMPWQNFTTSVDYIEAQTGYDLLDLLPDAIERSVEDRLPVATAQSVVVAEDGSIAVTLAGTDADGNALTYRVVTPPAHGSLSGTPPELTYTPESDYHGADSFTFVANDGVGDSASATVSVSVTSVNDAPVATAQAVQVEEDGTVTLTLAGTDVDGDALSFALVDAPEHGTLSGSPPDLVYTPAENYHGADRFTFTVSDGQVTSALATVSMEVTSVNDAPVAVAQALTTAEDIALVLDLTGTDVDGDVLGYTVVQAPSHGTLSGTAPHLTYIPAADFNGADSFTFTVSDGSATSAPAQVQLEITAVNDAPVALAQALTLDEDHAQPIVLSGRDVEGSPLTYAVVTQPAHGTLSGTPPELTYTPDADYQGTDSFTFTVSDGQATSEPAQVSLTVAQVNDAPVAAAAAYTLRQGETKDLVLAGTDADGDTLSYEVDTPPTGGTLTGTAPNLTYQPSAGFRGEDHFSYHVRDAAGATSASAVVTVTVENVAPLASVSASRLNPSEGEPVQFTATASDPGGDTLSYAWDFGDGTTSTEAQPSHAFANEGPREVSLTVSDGLASTAVALSLAVQNASPVVTDLTVPAQADEGHEVQFAAAASDPGAEDVLGYAWDFGDGSPLASGARVSHTYADNGAYTASLTVTDDAGASVTSTRVVDVHNLPPQPVAPGELSAKPGETLTYALQATDAAGAKDPLTWTLISGPGEVAADGTYRWTPTREQQGTSQAVEAEVADDDGGRTPVHFNVKVGQSPTNPHEDEGGCAAAGGLPSAWVMLALLGTLGQLKRRRAEARSSSLNG